MRKRRLAAWIAAPLAVGMFATACGGGGGVTAETGTIDDPITMEWGEPENPLVPGNTTEVNGGNVVDSMFTGLVQYNPETYEPENAMAESIEASPDKKSYTIKLKKGWKFHNGEEVTADNFVKAWNYTANADNAQKSAYFFDKVQGFEEVNPSDPDGDAGPQEAPKPTAQKMSGLEVVDPYTMKVTLNQPFTIFPQVIGYTAFAPLPDMFFEDKKKFEAHPIGNGPYKYEDRVPNESLTLTKYNDYKGERKGTVEAFRFKVYNKLSTAYQDLQSGNLDFMRQMPVSALTDGRWREELGDNAIDSTAMTVSTISFPLYDERFQNPDLRKAISMAIDRKSIVDNVFSGSRKPADGWVAPSVNGYAENQCGESCTYDKAKAKEYLQKAGGFEGTLTISSNADGGHEEWIKAVAGSIRDTLGIEAVYNPVPTFSELRTQVTANKMTGMFRSGWVADYPNIENFLDPIFSKGASSNDSGYSNPKFAELMAKADAAPTVEEANKLYAEAEKVLAGDMPSVPIYTQDIQAGKSDRLAEATVTPRRSLSLTSVRLADAQQ